MQAMYLMAACRDDLSRERLSPFSSQPHHTTDKPLRKWTVHALPLDNVSPHAFEANIAPVRSALEHGPAFFSGTFSVPSGAAAAGNAGFPADTFLHTPGFSKGLAWVNGFNLGW